jgi:hypothetical protein
MVELYKMDCDGNLYFCDYGLISKVEDYRLRGYVVRRAVANNNRRAIPKRGKIESTHRVAREGWATRFTNDCKHNWKIAKEIGVLFKDLFGFNSSRSRKRAAHAYFAAKAVPVAA